MTTLHEPFIIKKKKEKVFAIVFAILSVLIALTGFVLSCVYFETIGKGFFYLYSFLSLFLFGFLAIWGFILYGMDSYEISFWQKKGEEKEIISKVIKVSSYTVDRHFDSFKIALEGETFVYWFSPFGKCPFQEGKTYRIQAKNNWVDGWEEIS